MSEIIDKITHFTAEWYKLATAERPPSPEKQKNMVAIKDLPLYPETSTKPVYFVEDDPLPGQHYFQRVRESVQDSYFGVKEKFGFVGTVKDATVNTYTSVDNYIQREGAVIPRTVFITLGGLTGFYIGMKHYGLRKFLYAGLGLATVAAFCYPQEAIVIARTSYEHAKMKYEDFKKSPEPVVKKP